ncbi:hypothetical protein [Aeromonas salmonicida]|uniref:hypothetical protein n=1 Tax=Aeromonas salmonicida TaxID=645 RepID=UPI0015EC5C06|nr:hypothetical protein [Aeromonas salmonicida]
MKLMSSTTTRETPSSNSATYTASGHSTPSTGHTTDHPASYSIGTTTRAKPVTCGGTIP